MVAKQALLWGLMAHRKRIADVGGWSDMSVVKLSMQDGTTIFIALTGENLHPVNRP